MESKGLKQSLLIMLSYVLLMPLANAQSKSNRAFEQLGTELPTPNTYRTGSGSPGRDYFQQKADYKS